MTELPGKSVTATRFYREQLKHSASAIDYLKKRGLTGETAARFAIGYAPAGWQNLAAAFPNYEDQKLVASGLVKTNASDGESEDEGWQKSPPIIRCF